MRVLYVLGAGRSGSTLLGNVLGEADGCMHAGELRGIWGNGLIRGQSCGCGVPVPACEVWSLALSETFSDPTVLGSDPRTIERWKLTVRMRHTWRLLRLPRTRLLDRPEIRGYTTVMAGLYRHLGEVTGSDVVIDSSKRSSDGALLRLMEGIEPYYVHLVRDPRAVAFSWQRSKPSLGSPRLRYMPRFGANESTRHWTQLNAGAELIRRHVPPDRFMLVRYEDFIRDPRRTTSSIATFVGRPMPSTQFVDDRTVELRPNHTVGGNPDRLSSGTMRLRPDDEWMERQGRGDRFKATAIALPFLSRYGYEVRPAMHDAS